MCGHLNCRNRATFGYCRRNGEFCKEHKKDDMTLCFTLKYLWQKQLVHVSTNLDKQCRFAVVNRKTETMIDIKHKRCICGKAIPTFNELADLL